MGALGKEMEGDRVREGSGAQGDRGRQWEGEMGGRPERVLSS